MLSGVSPGRGKGFLTAVLLKVLLLQCLVNCGKCGLMLCLFSVELKSINTAMEGKPADFDDAPNTKYSVVC